MKPCLLLILIILLLLPFSGCKKTFDEGPLLSFRSIGKRLHGEWRVVKFYVNGYDSTETYSQRYGHVLDFHAPETHLDEDQSHEYYYFGFGVTTGLYHFIPLEDPDQLVLSYDFISLMIENLYVYPFNGTSDIVFDVKKLTTKELILESIIYDYNTRIEFQKKDN